MGDWHLGGVTTTTGGRFQIMITGRGKRAWAANVTILRGATTQINSYADADPFGDATAELNFPALTPFDDLDAPDLAPWLMEGASVDIYWRPARPVDTPGYPFRRKVVDPLTDNLDLITPWYQREAGTNKVIGPWRVKVWEGYIASIKASAGEDTFGLPVTCQGALFQLDRYRAAPYYPPDPWPMESLIVDQFHRKNRPQLRTRQLVVCFPDSWHHKIPDYQKFGATPTTPHGRPGDLWTGLATRNTGTWNPALTGFCQDLLTVMITQKAFGVRPGNQWTIAHYRHGQPLPTGQTKKGEPLGRAGLPSLGRQPVLQIRNRFAAPDFSLWLGAPGVEVDLDRDSTQAVDVIYGDGIDLDGQTWRNATVSDDGQRTSYQPLAYDHSVFPYTQARRNSEKMPLEGYTQYGNGFSFENGVSVAEQQLVFNQSPGWQGTITIKTDPSLELSRWQIHAGMVLRLKGFMGSGETGTKFHVAQAVHNPEMGAVQLTVDTRFRDLLTVAESIARTRDPLTPVKMLQVGLASVLVEDVQAPWDPRISGFVGGKHANRFFKLKPDNEQFPYLASCKRYPPRGNAQYYAGPVHASAPETKARWSMPSWPLLLSAKGSIIRTEIVCVDFYGNPKRIPFHVSIYYHNVKTWAMPHHLGSYSPWQLNAFERVDAVTGAPIDGKLAPDNSFIIGWGNSSPTLAHPNGVTDRPGYWPGRETAGSPPTGRFVDDFTWSYDLTAQRQYFKGRNPPGKHWQDTDVSVYLMFYAEADEPVYFIGRCYRQNPGST